MPVVEIELEPDWEDGPRLSMSPRLILDLKVESGNSFEGGAGFSDLLGPLRTPQEVAEDWGDNADDSGPFDGSPI